MNTFKKFIQPVYQQHRGASILISRLAVIGMMTCLGYGFAQFSNRMIKEAYPSFDVSFLLVFSILIASEAMSTQRRASILEGKDKFIFRSAEILTILIVLKIFLLLRSGIPSMVEEISRWQNEFTSSFFTGEFISGFFILGVIWATSTFLASDIDDLHDREQDAIWDELGKVQNALHAIRSRIMGVVFTLGGLTVFFAIGSRLNLRSYIPFLQGRFDPTISVANVVVFFVFLLILLSQTQFALLRTRWIWDKTPVPLHLGRNWLVYGIIFFTVLGVISFLLPTSYSMGFFETLAFLMNLMGEVFRFIIMLVLLPLTLCASLFGGKPLAQDDTPRPIPTVAPPAAVAGTVPSPFWEIVRSVLFWSVVVGVVVFALTQYIRANAGMFAGLARMPFLRWISIGLRAVWNWLVGANQVVRKVVAAGINRLRPSVQQLRRIQKAIRRPGGRTSREQIIEIYLALIDVGQQAGWNRRESETPYQYSQDLITGHPQVSAEILDLTEAFNEARYSAHQVDHEQVPRLRKAWERIRDSLYSPPQEYGIQPLSEVSSAENQADIPISPAKKN